MKIKNIRIKGVSTAFQGKDLTVNLEDLGEGIFAIVGDNGSGKTTLMEAMGPASLYRRFPSYGETFASHVPPGERAAVVELEFILDGTEYRTVLQADPMFSGGRGKTEAFLFERTWLDQTDDPAGWKPIAGPLVKDYDAAIGNLFPSEAAFLAGPFACQGGDGSFFSLERKGRRDLFAEYLQIEEVQTLAIQALVRGDETNSEASSGRVELAEMKEKRERGRVLRFDLLNVDQRLGGLRTEKTEAERREADASERVQTGKQELAGLEAQREEARKRNEEIEREETDKRAKAETLRSKIRDLVPLAEKKTSVMGADEEVTRLRLEGASAGKEERTLLEELGERRTEREAFRSAIEAADEKLTDLDGEEMDAKEAMRRIQEAGPVTAELEAARQRLEFHSDGVKSVERTIPAARRTAVKASEMWKRKDEIGVERSGLERQRVAFEGLEDPDAEMCQRCPLAVDAKAGFLRNASLRDELEGLPLEAKPGAALTVLSEAEEAVKQGGGIILSVTQEIAAWETKEAEVLRDWAVAERLAAIQAGIAYNLQNVQAKRKRFAEVNGRIGHLETVGTEATETGAFRVTRIRELETVLSEKDEILEAFGSLVSLREEAEGIEMTLEEAGARYDGPELRKTVEAIGVAEQALREEKVILAEKERKISLEEVERARIRAEQEAIDRDAGDEIFASLTKRVDTSTHEIAEWRILARALGREGIQALKIDAAGPEVSGIANDLLRSCGWGRFQISLITSAAKKDGGMKEVFEVRILDALADREARRGSGGEMVIIDESLRLALSIFNARRSGVSIETLWRDETVGALSSANASRYLEMLRRAREVGGFGAVYFVAHQREVWEQADGRIEIGPEGITVTR